MSAPFAYKSSSPGFTLLEVLLYLGLFAIVIGGLLTSTMMIFLGNDRTQTKIMVQEEMDFLLAKINATAIGAASISQPASGAEGSTLVVTKSGTPITFTLNAGSIQMQKGVGTPLTLNNSNITVSSLVFKHEGTGSNPESATVVFTLAAMTNGRVYAETASTTKYLRK